MPAKINITEEKIDEILPLNNKSNAGINISIKKKLKSGICLNEQECKEKVMELNKVTLSEFNQIWVAFTKFLDVQNEIVDYDKISEDDNIFLNGIGRFKYRMVSIKNDNIKGKMAKRGKVVKKK